MKLSDFDYQLPEELIAKYPSAQRSHSKLLKVDIGTQEITQHIFNELPHLLQKGDLLVFNNTKVFPARLFAHKPTGAKIEILLERILSPNEMLAHCRGKLKIGQELIIDQESKFIVLKHERLYHLQLHSHHPLPVLLNKYGHIPLPPYLNREDEAIDQERYQTIYAKTEGSVAAPTAGLHFDQDIFTALKAHDIDHTFITLHVGAGTFQPVKTENISEHQMHGELYEISPEAAKKINYTKQNGGRIIAVGTTSVRTLETATHNGLINPGIGETHIFIYPGYNFKIINGMLTNFHLPKSSLLMLVSAFASLDLIKTAYAIAIKKQYRFFSYGDAMLLLR